MYIYLSKKISVPNNALITACSWNQKDGFVAAGTQSSLVKVIKLEMVEGREAKNKSSTETNKSGLVMNESLEGHTGEIACITWNNLFNKLTTADSNGKIVVWVNFEGQWCEEMVNKRDNTIVTGMKWSSDGQQICIIYNDGVSIMGSLEGNRVWVKELKNSVLTNIEWAPDKRLLLFGLQSGEVHMFDFNGNFLEKMRIHCLDSMGVKLAAIDWYDGRNGFISSDSPALAICYSNGRCQIMKNETDEKPVILDCEIEIICAQWNHDGSILAIGGIQLMDDKEANIIQFFDPWGQHLKSLRIPGNRLKACSWESNSLRIVIAIDSLIYFANLRPQYKWCYFNNTIVYSFTKPSKTEQCVVFFDTKTGETSVKYMKRLLGIVGGGDNCALISQADDVTSSATNVTASTSFAASNKLNHQTQFAIVLCNSIGTPLEYKYIDFQPRYWDMNSSYIVVASRSYFYIWNYQSMVDRNSLKKQSFEKLVFIDNPNNSIQMKTDDPAIVAIGPNLQESKNAITCVKIADKFLFVGRESGYIQKFSLITGTVVEVFLNENNGIIASKISINCNATRMAIIDLNSVMKIYDLTTKVQREDLANFKRNDVWDVVWASDNPEMFVTMEKIKMHIFRETIPEEPVSCLGYICSFSDLQVKVIFMDDIMSRPEAPSQQDIVDMDTKSLRDTRQLLEKINLGEATQYIEKNSHPRLWASLAESALNKMDLKTAEHAFVKSKDYYGIEFVKKLQNIANQELKKAEIAAYFNGFDEAENLYLEVDRKDLAYQLRKKLGDWFKVLQLLKATSGNRRIIENEQDILDSDMAISTGSASDTQLEEAYSEIGDYYAERQRWDMAIKYYIIGRNLEKQAECYYVLEDYDSLVKVMDQLPENSELLLELAQMFESVGMCKEASEAYLKCQNVKAAVDTCIKLNQWDEGIRLAKQYNISQVDTLLAKQANKFLEQNKIFNAIELYRKARHYLDAARLMFEVAEKEAKQRNSPLLIKKMYVLSGLLVEQYRDLIKAGGILPSKTKIAQREQASKALDGILSEESQIAIKDSKILDNAWRGAESYHFYMLAERQLREGKINAAFKTSMALMDYDDILDPKHIYCLIALCACGNGLYNSASKAFIKLESCESIDEKERKEFETLAFQIFSIHPPKDKSPALKGDCPQCGTHITEWHTNCPSCDTKFAPCIVSGRPILEPQFWVCGSCKHRAIEQEIANRMSCPLCHMPVR